MYSDDFWFIYIAGACNGDTRKRKLPSVQLLFSSSQNMTVTHNYGTDYNSTLDGP